MGDSIPKRIREAKKRRRREIKAEKRRQRKDGEPVPVEEGQEEDMSGYFLPGEQPPQNEEEASRIRKSRNTPRNPTPNTK